jgi:hypothetical protein
MGPGETAYLTMTIGAFIVFAIVLAWISESERRR